MKVGSNITRALRMRTPPLTTDVLGPSHGFPPSSSEQLDQWFPDPVDPVKKLRLQKKENRGGLENKCPDIVPEAGAKRRQFGRKGNLGKNREEVISKVRFERPPPGLHFHPRTSIFSDLWISRPPQSGRVFCVAHPADIGTSASLKLEDRVYDGNKLEE